MSFQMQVTEVQKDIFILFNIKEAGESRNGIEVACWMLVYH